MTKGLAASGSPPQGPTVQLPASDGPQPAGAAPEIPSQTPVADSRTPTPAHKLITRASLQDLVAIRAAHPRPLGRDTACLARTVYEEAANQTLKGQLAVAQVVVNRMKSARHPTSACAVVGQPGQFAHADTDVVLGRSKPWDTAVAIATLAQEERVAQVAPGALFFHATYVSPPWSQTHQRIAQIGDHIFYR